MVLQQFVINLAGVNEWMSDTPPITVIGDPTWTDYRVTVDVRIAASNESLFANIYSVANGWCLDVNGKSPYSGGFIDTYDCLSDYNEQVCGCEVMLASV